MQKKRRRVRRQPSEEAAEAQEREPVARRREGRRAASARPLGQVIGALVIGLVVGFAVGREVSQSSVKGDTASSESDAGENVKTYERLADLPATWVKDLPGDYLKGLSEQQQVNVIQALNERNCECGCSFGTLANCVKEDPHCPRSPVLARLAADTAKQGKGVAEVLAAVDAKQRELNGGKAPSPSEPAAAPPPAGRRYIQLAAHNPRKGPAHAKVTIVEFSEFQ